jgi:AcrR family transcriptional regulator
MAKARKRSRGEAKRGEILKIATELFLKNGYDGVSVDSIIARAGGTKTNVYKFFGGKAELFAAVAEDLCHQIVFEFADADLDGLAVDEALRKLGRGFVSALLTPRSLRQHRMIVAESVRFPGVGQRWFKAGPESAYAPVAAFLERQQKAGRIRSTIPGRRLAAMFFDMMIHETHLRMLVAGAAAPSTREINKLVDQSVDVLLHGVAAGRSR